VLYVEFFGYILTPLQGICP